MVYVRVADVILHFQIQLVDIIKNICFITGGVIRTDIFLNKPIIVCCYHIDHKKISGSVILIESTHSFFYY